MSIGALFYWIAIVGHSHGGNVAILVANELAKQGIQVDTLITIATPAREYELNNSVSERIQLYTEEDYVQKLGGECLIADRIFDDAINIEVPEEEFQTSEEKGPIDSHSAMHSNIRIWEKYLKQQLRIFKVNKMLNNLAY